MLCFHNYKYHVFVKIELFAVHFHSVTHSVHLLILLQTSWLVRAIVQSYGLSLDTCLEDSGTDLASAMMVMLHQGSDSTTQGPHTFYHSSTRKHIEQQSWYVNSL